MNSQKSLSLQTILKRRQQGEFVGREEQLNLFRQNLIFDLNDDRRRFVFNVFGQGGVGKTSLLRRYSQLAKDCNAIIAWTDEIEEDAPAVMGRISQQLERQDQAFKASNERYRIYRQRCHELEADPEAPPGFSAFMGRIVAKTSVYLGRRIPIGGILLDYIDEDSFATQVSEWTTYVARKLTNKDEVHLLQEPNRVLSPLFLEGLQKLAEKHLIALFFDSYERTGEFLDDWLRDILEGHHGDVAANIVLAIAGRDELDRNRWVPYEGLLVRLPLEPFTEEEARDYLIRKNITDKYVVEVILSLSGRLPLLVATLAIGSPDNPNRIGDPSGTAVERFLKWEEDQSRRQTALDAALPHQLNQDVLAELVGDKESETLFNWLKQTPFVEKRTHGWTYHEVVRTQMLHYKRHVSPQSWAVLHGRLANYYERLRDNLGLDEEQARRDPTWQSFALEALYHHLCQEPYMQLSAALNGFLIAFEAQRAFARRWVESIQQAGNDTEVVEIQHWGIRLIEGVKAYYEGHYNVAAEMFRTLSRQADINVRCSSIASGWFGCLSLQADQYEQALMGLTEAIELAPENSEYWVDRGCTYYWMECYPEALADFSRAIELRPGDAWIIANRGVIYWLIENYEKALRDSTLAIKLRSDDVWAIFLRGLVYQKMKHYDEALADFTRVIELRPDDARAIVNRGTTYQLMERYKEAQEDFDLAFAIDRTIINVLNDRSLFGNIFYGREIEKGDKY